MPVSSPSYFPPATSGGSIVGTTAGQGATGVRTFLAGANAGKFTQPVNDLIVIGDNAESAGTQAAPLTNANLSGQIVIGSGAVLAQTTALEQVNGASYPSIVVGKSAAVSVLDLSCSIVVGANALATYQGTTAGNTGVNACVVLGAGAMQNLAYSFGVTPQAFANVVIGATAAQGNAAPNNIGMVSSCVIIGAQACQNMGTNAANGGISHSVIIGASAALTIATTAAATNLVVIGDSCMSGLNNGATSDTVIGQNCAAGAGAMQFTTGVGQGLTLVGDSSVVLGANAQTGGMVAGQIGGVFIGSGAGQFGTGGSHQFALETVIASTPRTLMVGNFANGTLVLGGSVQGANRDQQGTNTLKIINGAKGGANPTGGGYFYVTGSVLHWVDAAGNDTQVSVSTAGQLAANALVAYTNNAGAAAGTLTNAPIAGNPTKWIPINDNGTIRNIPAW